MESSDLPESAREPYHAWAERVTAVVDEAHTENLGGQHCEGFCVACANAYLVAQRAVPGGPGDPPVSPAVEEPRGAWQDPSTDIENVNAAYVIERDENARLRAETLRQGQRITELGALLVASEERIERYREALGELAGLCPPHIMERYRGNGARTWPVPLHRRRSRC